MFFDLLSRNTKARHSEGPSGGAESPHTKGRTTSSRRRQIQGCPVHGDEIQCSSRLEWLQPEIELRGRRCRGTPASLTWRCCWGHRDSVSGGAPASTRRSPMWRKVPRPQRMGKPRLSVSLGLASIVHGLWPALERRRGWSWHAKNFRDPWDL